MADSGTIFKRGIANCFVNLDRRFRSHDGWKIGSRVILSNAFNEWGSWNYHRNHRDTLTRKSTAFRQLMTEMRASWRDLPPGSFAESGTYVNAVVLRVWNDRRAQHSWE